MEAVNLKYKIKDTTIDFCVILDITNVEAYHVFIGALKNNRVTIHALAFTNPETNLEVYEGDRVIVDSPKGEYETIVIKSLHGFTLKDNFTNLKDTACLLAVKKLK